MTREEAKKEFWTNIFKNIFSNMNDYDKILKMSYKGQVMDNFIDEIYNDFLHDTHLENGEFKYCPYCQKKIKEML